MLIHVHFCRRLLEFGHTITITYELYRTTIILWDTPNVQLLPHPSLGAVIILGAYIATHTQVRHPRCASDEIICTDTTRPGILLLFCYRLYTVLPSPLQLVGPITAPSSGARCVLVMYAGVVGFTASSYAFAVHMHSWVTALLALGAGIGVVIATAMIYFLLTKREHSVVRTSRLIDRLIAFTLRTGPRTGPGLVTRYVEHLFL